MVEDDTGLLGAARTVAPNGCSAAFHRQVATLVGKADSEPPHIAQPFSVEEPAFFMSPSITAPSGGA
jgi:hypothetical protein